MSSLILRTAARYTFPLLLVVSIYLLLRGHNEPGGGFVGGLAAASGYILYALAYDAAAARRLLRVDGRLLVSAGLLLAASSTLPALFVGKPWMTSLWGTLRLPAMPPIKLGTPLLFDLGVYLVVLGVTVTFIFSLQDEGSGEPPRAGGG